MATRTGLPYVLIFPGLVLIFYPNFCPGWVYKFVEKFGFLTICHFSKLLLILIVMRMQKYKVYSNTF